MNNLVSIIIPTYNRADLIIKTLESIRNQTYQHFECLIIDDGSNDSTEQIVQLFIDSDNRFEFFKRPSDTKKGPNTCRNYGFVKAKGNFIYFFDSDDFLKPHALETYIKGFQTDTDGVLAQVERVDRETGILQDINTIESNNLIEDYFTYKICYFVCGILWRKSFLDTQNELFDESIGNHDEWDFNLRMIYAQPKIIKIKQALVIYYQHNHSFKNEVRKGNDIEINSAFKARLKHLYLLIKLNPNNKIKYTNHLADFYIKTVRNKILFGQSNWFSYYKSSVYFKLKTFSFISIIKLSIGIVLLKFFGKGYSFFK
ncbi:MAG TPA: glycosyltransferase family A protein [Flavobacterium sp.]|uniref:glycosyltransferase family 2 protein n=1 Tax=unclassified Flavobacterium TaxID=196869 RepID=UPI0025C38320|nr:MULTISPECIES: glycosyltransferase family A protein [unclassified Flavobacterium]HRE79347.1 glycosyltransferase family A protein [Flavobacterium sp.]